MPNNFFIVSKNEMMGVVDDNGNVKIALIYRDIHLHGGYIKYGNIGYLHITELK